MQLISKRFGTARKTLATSVAAALLVAGLGASSAQADATTDAIAEVKTSVTAVNDNVKLLAAQVTTLQAAVATLIDRKSTRLNSSHIPLSRMPSSA